MKSVQVRCSEIASFFRDLCNSSIILSRISMKKSDKDFIFGFKSKRFFEGIIPIKDDEQKVAAMIEWVHLNDTLIVTY